MDKRYKNIKIAEKKIKYADVVDDGGDELSEPPCAWNIAMRSLIDDMAEKKEKKKEQGKQRN